MSSACASLESQPATETLPISDVDRDSLHTISISILPINRLALRRARLVKNARLEGVIELFNNAGSGSGQMTVSGVSKMLEIPVAPPDPDIALLKQVADLPSFDVYSLRILLRDAGIAIGDADALTLSPARIQSLNLYMTAFTRPLIEEVVGQHSDISEFSNIVNLFRNCNAETIRARIAILAGKLGTPVSEIPNFLENYGDVFMSLSYYRQCLDQTLPNIQAFMNSINDIRDVRVLRQDTNLMSTVTFMEETVNGLLADIAGRIESFERATKDMWRNLTADRFRKIEALILTYHTTIGGVLCALSVKMDAWCRQFPQSSNSSPQSRANFIMSEMRPGVDRVWALKKSAPVLSELDI